MMEPNPLRKRETEVIRRIAEGKNLKQIAHDMGISVYTARRHVEEAKRTTGLNKSVAIVAKALRNGWIE